MRNERERKRNSDENKQENKNKNKQQKHILCHDQRVRGVSQLVDPHQVGEGDVQPAEPDEL
jgi:hypothetical protein